MLLLLLWFWFFCALSGYLIFFQPIFHFRAPPKARFRHWLWHLHRAFLWTPELVVQCSCDMLASGWTWRSNNVWCKLELWLIAKGCTKHSLPSINNQHFETGCAGRIPSSTNFLGHLSHLRCCHIVKSYKRNGIIWWRWNEQCQGIKKLAFQALAENVIYSLLLAFGIRIGTKWWIWKNTI